MGAKEQIIWHLIKRTGSKKQMSQRLSFEKLNNTRNLGGMKTADGSVIKSGLLIRSGHLADVTESDRAKLAAAVRTIVDFRTDGERKEQPDKDIPGCENVYIPVVESLTAGISREKRADRKVFSLLLLKPVQARQYMCDMYKGFAGDFAVSQYGRFLKLLLDAEGCVLWHCTAGKDRAGIASALIEEILGVDRKEIIADYLLTNEYLKKDVSSLIRFIKKMNGTDSELADEALGYLLGAKEEYIMSFYSAAEERYGSFDGFVRHGLGIGDSEKQALREKYLEAGKQNQGRTR